MESVLLPGDVLEDDGIGMVVDGDKDKAAIEEADEEETGVETNKSVEVEEEETGVDMAEETIKEVEVEVDVVMIMVNEVIGVGIETEEDMVVSQTGEGVAGKEALDMVEETNKEVEGVRVDVVTVGDIMVNEVLGVGTEGEETEDIDKDLPPGASGSRALAQRRMQVSY